MVRPTMWKAFLDTLPRGYTLEDADWQRRHRLLLKLLAAHIPGLLLFGLFFGTSPPALLSALVPPVICTAFGYYLSQHRRTAAVIVTGGLVYCSGALVGLTNGAIEAHFHFFIIIGFIALYQDWAPFLFNILFTVLSHGIGSFWQQNLIFAHPAGQGNPWLWSLIHGVAVLFACVGMMLFWRVTEESQNEKDTLARKLADAEIGKRQFTSDLLVNLARRNQSMLYRQLEIINQLEESERDPEALADLFTLDHLATRVRRNAESLLVLSGEQPPRTWSEAVPLRDVLRAAIAETEDLERVTFVVDERPAVAGHTVTDLTHLLAELTENAVRFSPPDSIVTIRARADRNDPGGQLLTVEDWGVGMPPADLAAANELLGVPPEIDLSVSQRLGFHVVARLAARHGIRVSLTNTPGSGVTAVVVLPPGLFESVTPGAGAQYRYDGDRRARAMEITQTVTPPQAVRAGRTAHVATLPRSTTPSTTRADGPAPFGSAGDWQGWWDPAVRRSDPGAEHGASPAEPVIPRPRPGPAVPQRPEPLPAPARAAPAADPVTGLRRRVPQTHLAPELREPAAATGADNGNTPDHGAPPSRHTVEAANALSRYQASRQAAQSAAADPSFEQANGANSRGERGWPS